MFSYITKINQTCLDERIGNLTVVVNDPSVLPAFKSQMSLVIRANWSNPPSHGSRIVAMILTTPAMRQQWLDSMKVKPYSYGTVNFQ